MANPSITLDNQTVSTITLVQLGLDVPGSGSILATDSVLVDEVLFDPELNTFIDSGDITLTVDAVAMTAAQSQAYVGYFRSLDNRAGTTAPTVNDDADAGYSVGSVWIDTTNDTAYICVDETNNTAVWVSAGGADAFATPVDIGTANAEGSLGTHSRSDHVHDHADQPGGSLHAVVTTSVNGFMSAADKTILDGITGNSASYGTIFVSGTVTSSSTSFVDGLAGGSVSPPVDGDYMVLFNGNASGSTGNTETEFGISVNSTTTTVGDSDRRAQGNGGDNIPASTHTVITGLVSSDLIRVLFRRSMGSGSSSLIDRRVTLIRVS